MTPLEQLKSRVDAAASPALSDTDLQNALDASLIPDDAGVWPGRPGYVTTYDLDWAAAEACTIRAFRVAAQTTETVTRISSEGSAFEAKTVRPDWSGLARRWRIRSKIGQAIGYGAALGVIEVNQPAVGYVPASSKAQQWT